VLRRYVAVCVCLLMAFAQAGYALSVTSTASRVSLVELYTSEGCSSCPPAETWLNTLKTHPDLWSKMVPVAFHVDYWDDLGWKDRLASPVFTHRQRKYRDEWKGRYLYTPCVALNGREWPKWRDRAALPLGTNDVGVLSLNFQEQTLRVEWEPARKFAKYYELYVALVGFGVSSDIKAGENTGRTLKRDFVVLQYAQRRVKQRKGQLYDKMTSDVSKPVDVSEKALVAWVTEKKSVYPIQAVGAMLTPLSAE